MANSSSDLSSFMPEHELVELLWEDGQIVMQGQSNRTKKSSLVTELGFNGRFDDKSSGDEASVVKFGRTEAADSAHDLLRSVPTVMNSNEVDTAHWMNYPIQNDFCSEFFSEITNDMTCLSNTSSSLNLPADKITGLGQLARDSNGFSRFPPVASETNKSSSRFNNLSGMPQQCQIFSENAKSRVIDLDSSTHHNNSSNNSSKRFPKHDAAAQKPSQKFTGAGLLNFSHFSRPAALFKANLQSIERLQEKSSSATARTGAVESTLVDLSSNGKPMANSSSTHCQNSSFDASMMNKKRSETERASETVVASSSVCSGYSAGAASIDQNLRPKKRAREGEESGEQSDDLENDSFAVKEHSSGKVTSGKRSRAAEVHNLSERRRRDRINEKMKALQELIPNCNKVDKASMLDEAIEYLKTLQLQVQMMSMGSGLCMTPMMLPAGLNVQHLRAPQMASFSPLGFGMGMGLGFGMGMIDLNGSPGLISVPPMPGTGQYPCPSVPSVPGLYRMPHSSTIHFPASFSPPNTLLNPWQVSDTAPSTSQQIKQQQCINSEPKGEASQAARLKDGQAELQGSSGIKGTASTG